jgi:hypothetical protein
VIARADFHLSHSYTQLWRLAGGDVGQIRLDMHIAVSAGSSVHSRFSKDVNERVKKAALGDTLCQPVITAAAKGIRK